MNSENQDLMAGLVSETALCLLDNAGSMADHTKLSMALAEHMGGTPLIMTDELAGPVSGFVPSHTVYCEFENGVYFAGEAGAIADQGPAVIGGFGSALSSAPDYLLVPYTALEYLLANNLV